MILGLDVSTSITGFCVIDANGEVIRCDAWDMRNKNKFKSEFEKAAYIKEQLVLIKVQYPIDRVFVEKPFTFFKSGGSSGKTMAILQRFNGIVSWLANEVFSQEPEYLTAAEARKLLSIKVERGKNTKKKVVEWLLENVSNFKVEYTSHGNPKPKYFDIGDAIVIAKAGLKKLGMKKSLDN
jgi:Holliday junction resolvasome RuvABC endonuclease subunit